MKVAFAKGQLHAGVNATAEAAGTWQQMNIENPVDYHSGLESQGWMNQATRLPSFLVRQGIQTSP